MNILTYHWWWWNNQSHYKVHPLMSLNICMNFWGYQSVAVEIFLYDSPKSYCHRYRLTLFQQVAAQTLFVFSLLFFLLAMFQSKDIGIQMHEELVKVTNELYTVSNSLCLPQTFSSLNSSKVISSLSVFLTFYFMFHVACLPFFWHFCTFPFLILYLSKYLEIALVCSFVYFI